MSEIASLIKVMQEQMQRQEEHHQQQVERHQQQEERHQQQLAMLQQQLDEQRKSGGTFTSQKQTWIQQQNHGKTICYALKDS